MGRRKSDGGKKTASVTGSLSKTATPKGRGGAHTAGNGPLEEMTHDDLAAQGSLRSDEVSVAPVDVAEARSGLVPTSLEIEISTDSGPHRAAGRSGRRQDRVPWSAVVDVRGVFAGPVQGEPRTKDLSAGGVFVETAHLLEVGDPVVLSFPLDDGKRLVVNGRVRWVTPFGRVDDPTPGMGIEFVGLDDQRREKIAAVLARTR